MSKKEKSVGLSADTSRNLQLQAIDREGVSYKLHCEDILERASKMSSKDVLSWLGGEKKSSRKKIVEKTVEDVVVDEEAISAENPMDKKHFDVSGEFVRVEDKIYTNKKCFEYRILIMGHGQSKMYFKTLEEAQDYKNN